MYGISIHGMFAGLSLNIAAISTGYYQVLLEDRWEYKHHPAFIWKSCKAIELFASLGLESVLFSCCSCSRGYCEMAWNTHRLLLVMWFFMVPSMYFPSWPNMRIQRQCVCVIVCVYLFIDLAIYLPIYLCVCLLCLFILFVCLFVVCLFIYVSIDRSTDR